jgi:hypothetical protein
VLAAYSGHTDCGLAALAFTESVDVDRLLVGTRYQAQFGQSPFAIARGMQFEQSIRADGYARVLELMRERMQFSVDDAKVVNLRVGYPRNRDGLEQRAVATRRLIGRVLEGSQEAPNLLDGAVLTGEIAGTTAYFEADAVAARFDGPIHAGEVKSFPVVDGRPEPDKLGAALDQVSVYLLLIGQLVEQLGGDPEAAISSKAMLIAPKNVGLTPTLETQDVAARVRRIRTLLGQPLPAAQSRAGIQPRVFERIADTSVPEKDRLRELNVLSSTVGTKLTSGCLATCGLARYCRSSHAACGSPIVGGEQLVRLLPGVQDLSRATELAAGVQPSAPEAPVARQLVRAGKLHAQRFGPEQVVAAGPVST